MRSRSSPRRLFAKDMPPYGGKRTHHVHVTEPAGKLWQRLTFRDGLSRLDEPHALRR